MFQRLESALRSKRVDGFQVTGWQLKVENSSENGGTADSRPQALENCRTEVFIVLGGDSDPP
jgi:hypothetical protein